VTTGETLLGALFDVELPPFGDLHETRLRSRVGAVTTHASSRARPVGRSSPGRTGVFERLNPLDRSELAGGARPWSRLRHERTGDGALALDRAAPGRQELRLVRFRGEVEVRSSFRRVAGQSFAIRHGRTPLLRQRRFVATAGREQAAVTRYGCR